jgi:aryl-alcohol dehydrogenase-like predicted oxidoreductase
LKVLEAVEQIASEHQASPSQIALAWCMNQPGITSPIIGPRTVEQLRDNLGGLGVKLTPEDQTRLDLVAPPGRAVVPYYGADGLAWTTFGPHTHRW